MTPQLSISQVHIRSMEYVTRTDKQRRLSPGNRDEMALSARVPVQAVVRGFLGGLVATAVMTVYRAPIFRALPPTAEFWARYLGGGEAEQYFLEGLVLHFLYGGVAGGVLGFLLANINPRTSLDRELTSLFAGLVYGLFLSVFGTRVLFRYVLERDLDPEQALVFHVGHVIYGLTLGTWIGSRERVGEVYE